MAPLLDGACLVAFVALGRESHGIGSGIGWFLTVLWPFAVGWFAVALAAGLYRADASWARLVATWALGIALALVLRAVLTDRESLSTFTVVVYVFTGLFTFGWRGVARAARRLAPGPGS